MAIIALEFEDTQVRVASARVSGKRLQIQNLFSVELGGDDTSAAQQLKSALAKHGLARSEAIVVINRASVEMRELSVPPAPNNELPGMVRFIARNEFALFNDAWVLDYVPLSDDASEMRTVLAVAISPELNQQISSMAESAGLKIRHMVLRPYAAIELVRDRLGDGKCRMIVDLNGDQADLTIVDGENLVATRTVRVPGDLEAGKRAKMITSELRRTLASSQRNLGDRKVSTVMIFGDGRGNEALENLMKTELGLDVDFVSPLQCVPVKSGFHAPENVAQYAALIGALVGQNSTRKHTIDFSNPRMPVKVRSDRSKLYLYGGVAAGIAVVVIGIGWWILHSQTSTIASLRQEVNELAKANEGGNGKLGVDQILGEVSAIDRWKLKDVDWLEELYQYSDRSLTADDVIVDLFNAELNRREKELPKIIVNTRAATVESESDLFRSLKERPYDVKPGGGRIDSRDESYPQVNTYDLRLEVDSRKQMRQLDEDTSEYLKRKMADAKAAREAAANEASESSSPKDKTQ